MTLFSLRAKLILAFLLVVITAIGIVTFFNERAIRTQLTQDAAENLQNLAASKAQAIGDLLAKQADTLQALSVNRALQEGAEAKSLAYTGRPDEVRATIEQLDEAWPSAGNASPLVQSVVNGAVADELLRYRNTFPENAEILLTDRYGALVAATNRLDAYDYNAEPWWQVAYQNGRGKLYLGLSSTNDRLVLAVPVYGRRTPVVAGVLRAELPLYAFFDLPIFQPFGETGRVDLLLADGRFWISEQSAPLFLSNEPADAEPILQAISQDALRFHSLAPVTTLDPSSRVAVDDLGWQIVVHQERAETLSPVRASLFTTLLAGISALFFSGLLAIMVAQTLARPINRLTHLTAQVAAGDFNARVSVESADEIGALAGSFNTMTTQLRHTLDALRERSRALEASAEVARAISASLDLDETLQTTVNLICERFGFYYAAIFLIEPGSGLAVLRESTGEIGNLLKTQQYQLPVGSRSLIGAVTAGRQPLIAQNVATTPFHLKNPLLPDTQSEAVFPLLTGDIVVGALDVQSKNLNAFTPAMIAILSTLADQLAIAVQHAHLYGRQKEAAEQLATLDQSKTLFLANMSHELRTPLNAVIGFSQILLEGLEGPMSETAQQDLTMIHQAGRHLLRIINDLLDISRISMGKLNLTFEEVDLRLLIQEVLQATTPLLADKPITVTDRYDPQLPIICGDATRIRQLLYNLISNAAKFTEAGRITICARPAEAPRPGSHNLEPFVEISVSDTGIGIAAADRVKLFKPFSQVDDSLSRKTGGSGLGLSICYHLVELHGGRIWVESQPGRGSTFTFILPVNQPQAETPNSQAPNGNSQLPIPNLQSPISNPQPPTPNLQSPIPNPPTP
jgi:signal transduction histidine kinase/HAMP domain-containing protein